MDEEVVIQKDQKEVEVAEDEEVEEIVLKILELPLTRLDNKRLVVKSSAMSTV